MPPRRRIKPDTTLDSEQHIAHAIKQNIEESRVLRPRHGNVEPPIRQIHPILREFGLYDVCTFQAPKLTHQVSAPLVSALVERWRPETHTFHLPHGECAVTLEDVSVLLGIPVVGTPAATISTSFTDEVLSDMCTQYLGVTPPPGEVKNSFISLSWLDINFNDVIRRDAHRFDEDRVTQWHARGYLLRLFGHVLFCEKHDTKIHGKYLAMLRDMDTARNFSWGSAVLAVLDRNLCRATRISCAQMGGCLLLLVSWAYFRLPKFAPLRLANDIYEFPLASRWNHSVGWGNNFRYRTLHEIRDAIDRMQPNEFVWQPYENPLIAACIPDHVNAMRHYWPTVCPLICGEIVEWHAADHVMRQFGFQQPAPTNVGSSCLGESHNRDLRRNPQGTVMNWISEHQRWHVMWMERVTLNGHPIMNGDYSPSVDYWEWYNYFGQDLYLSTEFQIPNIPARPVPVVFYPVHPPPHLHEEMPPPQHQQYYTPPPQPTQQCSPFESHQFDMPFSQLLSFDMTQFLSTQQHYSGVASSSQIPQHEMQPHRSSCYAGPSHDDVGSSRAQAGSRRSLDVASSSDQAFQFQMGLQNMPPQPSFVEDVPTGFEEVESERSPDEVNISRTGTRRGNILTRTVQRVLGRRGDGPERYNLRVSGERRAPNRYTPTQADRDSR